MTEPTRVLGVDQKGFATADAIPPNTLLNKYNYNVERVIGTGGFGVTYLARDLQLERMVVIKECFPEGICYRDGLKVAVRSPQHKAHYIKCVQMFLREARSIAQLSHPNIVNVYAIFEENQTAYMVLDLVEGADLLDVIEKQEIELSPGHIQAILADTLSALTAVHDQNLLHRDISPDNILLDHQGRPFLIDFGSAREFASERTRGQSTLLFVKDGYSPFEFYVSGAAHSPASDLYALGGTFYHLIAGKAPPSSQFRHVEQQAGQPDPWEPLAGRFEGYSEGFLEAIDKALSLVPALRIQSTREWLKVLVSFEANAGQASATSRFESPPSLGNLVSETNREVLGDVSDERPQPLRFDDLSVDLGHQPDWKDEFNRETEELIAEEQFSEQDVTRDYGAQTNERMSAKAVLNDAGEQNTHNDSESVPSAEGLIAAYYQRIDTRRSRRSNSSIAGLPYLFGGAGVALLALIIAVNQQRMEEDGSWSVFMSLQGICRNETLKANTPVPIECEGRSDAREIKLEDRDMILRLHNTDHLR